MFIFVDKRIIMKAIALRIIILLVILISTKAFAQIPSSPNCPAPAAVDSINITGQNITSCGLPVTLTAQAFSAFPSTASYSISHPAYIPFPFTGSNVPQTNNFGGIVDLATIDDVWSIPYVLPFSFNFFCNQYDTFLIGSNGNISFNIQNANSINQFNFQTVTMPNNNSTWNNSINSPHSDIHPQPGTGCSITWQVYGSAPCRALVVSWDSVGYFPVQSCGFARTTSQIVIYESTNIIDLNIKYKQLCSTNTSNAATAHQGIQNNAGNIAYTVPGHNGGLWTDSFSTWRFTPNSNFVYTWYNVTTGAIVGNSSTITVNPLDTTKYAVLAVYNGCNSILQLLDTIQVNVTNPTIANFTADILLACEDDTIKFTNTSIGAVNYQWNFGDGLNSQATNPKHTYITQNIYTVTLIATDGTCKDTIKKVFDLRHPIDAKLNSLDSFCLANPVAGVNVLMDISQSIGGGLKSVITISDGTVINKNNLSLTSHNINTAGIYTISLKVTDTLGCVDTFSKKIFIDNTPFANFTVTDSNICLGEPISFFDTIPQFAQSFSYDFGDAFVLNNYHNPSHNYTVTQNPFVVKLTTTYLVCPDYIFAKNIKVSNTPIIDIGSDTSFCLNLYSSKQLGNNVNLNSSINNYLWNTGEVTPKITASTPGTYWLQGTNSDGCTNADTITIANDCYLVIPNAFTPGADGLNERFMLKENTFAGVISYSMNIFNRWGQNIFSTTNVNSSGWDGKFGGKNQPMGVYIYQIAVVFKNGERKNYTGNITLLR